MSVARRINLHRPLLEGQKRRARRVKGAMAAGGVFLALILGLVIHREREASEIQASAQRVGALIEAERAQSRALALTAALPANESARAEGRLWQERARAKEAFLAHPERFAPAELKEWEQMLRTLEAASESEPGARLERFEASVSSEAPEPALELSGTAPSPEAALGFARAASRAKALSDLSVSEARLAPAANGAEGRGWAFSIKGGAKREP